MSTAPANERSVNRALAKAGVPVTVHKYSGYLHIETIDQDGPEVDSIFVCYWHEMSLAQWVEAVAGNYADAMARGY